MLQYNKSGRWALLGSGAVLIEPEQAGEDFVVGKRACAPVGGPAVGFGHGLVEDFVGVGQPGGAGVVEVGQGAFFSGWLRPRGTGAGGGQGSLTGVCRKKWAS